MSDFGEFLTFARKQAGFASLGEAARAASELFGKDGAQLSKARLSLYERGAVETLKPVVIKSLSRLYRVPYEELAQRWFSDRYGLQISAQPRKARGAEAAEYVLQDPTSGEQLSLISVAEFQQLQARIPEGTQVGVAALRFLDDTVYFEMVSKNIRRGIRYYYVLPESQRVTYQHLLSKLGAKHPELRDKLDGKRTFFIPRSDYDAPINEVIYVYPNGEVRGFMGLLSDDRPCFFQIVKDRLAMRLFSSFSWMIRVGRDQKVQAAVRALERQVLAAGKAGVGFE